MKAALVPFFQAIVLVLAVIIAVGVAPAGSSPWAALLMPMVGTLVFLVLSAIIVRSSFKIAQRAHALMLVAIVLLAVGLVGQAFDMTRTNLRHISAIDNYEAALDAGEIQRDTEAAREAYLRKADAPLHSLTHLTNTYWTLAAFSMAFFFAGIATRPGTRQSSSASASASTAPAAQ